MASRRDTVDSGAGLVCWAVYTGMNPSEQLRCSDLEKRENVRIRNGVDFSRG